MVLYRTIRINGSLKNLGEKGSLWNQKWFFYGITLKNHFWFQITFFGCVANLKNPADVLCFASRNLNTKLDAPRPDFSQACSLGPPNSHGTNPVLFRVREQRNQKVAEMES